MDLMLLFLSKVFEFAPPPPPLARPPISPPQSHPPTHDRPTYRIFIFETVLRCMDTKRNRGTTRNARHDHAKCDISITCCTGPRPELQRHLRRRRTSGLFDRLALSEQRNEYKGPPSYYSYWFKQNCMHSTAIAVSA